jgi:glycerate kinase
MRVVICPDKFAGTMDAPTAARAIADGWAQTAPDDELVLVPLADGGPGFGDVLHARLGGQLLAVTVRGPLGAPVPATVLLVQDGATTTAYVESAQACGLHLVPACDRDPEGATSYGVGELVAAAVDEGAERVVIGLGGSATTDGGAGLLAALGAQPAADLSRGGRGLADLNELDLEPARRRVHGVELVAATDVDNVLLGLRGAANTFARQKGADDAAVLALEDALRRLVGLAEPGVRAALTVANRPGAGAAGGLGYALALLGARREPGIGTVLQAVGLDDQVRHADLVITGEGCLDWQSLSGKVVSGVTEVALSSGRPVVVLAGQVQLGRRELGALGVAAAYPVATTPVERKEALAHPVQTLTALAQRVARTWSRRR